MNDAATALDDTALLAAFEQGTLPPADWNHRSHVRVGFLYARQHDLDDAVKRMRAGLNALNAAHRVPDLPNRGYHETITVAFLRLIHSRCQAECYSSSLAFCDLNPDLTNKDALLHYYSPDRLSSPAAKMQFLEPDLVPLPG